MIQIGRMARGRRPLVGLVALVLLALGLLAGGALVAGCGRPAGSPGTARATKQLYRCPMHPNYVSDRPGNCPICGMKLVPIPPGAEPGVEAATAPPAGAA
jgi:hypothetical protein